MAARRIHMGVERNARSFLAETFAIAEPGTPPTVFQSPSGCDLYPVFPPEITSHEGELLATVVWRVTPPPLDDIPRRKVASKRKAKRKSKR